MKKAPNKLIDTSSPYLQQHAYNPVDWYPWGDQALAKAKEEDKPIIVSIGYSSCHWCHVMERESFENEEIATIMNEYFISIKVDREERPDVDNIYMDAIHAMGQAGGWPLNVFLTPDQKPFYGGTYFPPQNWTQMLLRIAEVFRKERKQVEDSADKFTNYLSQSETKKFGIEFSEQEFSINKIKEAYQLLKQRFDTKKGGMAKAPKFPMPSIWKFLLDYYYFTKDKEALKQVELTLMGMAQGGIYDQVGGGFSRYSVDGNWLVPHFEKMLYDNAQLISLYSEAYKISRNNRFKEVVYQTIEWIRREMTAPNGGFYSALDADSEGVEGKYYTWTVKELKKVLKKDAETFINYFQATEKGNMENGLNILHAPVDIENEVEGKGLKFTNLKIEIEQGIDKLLKVRNQRISPALDDKILTAWNGLMIKGLVDAYFAFEDNQFLDLALANANYIENNIRKENFLYRTSHQGKVALSGYLEDYASVSQAYIALYQATFNEHWVNTAKLLTDYTIKNFYDETDGFFFFADKNSKALIARKTELLDNVIPASNSITAHNLHLLGIIYDEEKYKKYSDRMTGSMSKLIFTELEYNANWGSLYLFKAKPTAEVVIVGKNAIRYSKKIGTNYLSNKILMGTKDKSELPLFNHRTTINNKTTIYVCYHKACQLPVTSVNDALDILR